MKYVCILQSVNHPTKHHAGLTDDLRARRRAHCTGQVYHTSKYRPWNLNTYVGFSDAERAVPFEKYLKTRSGHPFARKRP